MGWPASKAALGMWLALSAVQGWAQPAGNEAAQTADGAFTFLGRTLPGLHQIDAFDGGHADGTITSFVKDNECQVSLRQHDYRMFLDGQAAPISAVANKQWHRLSLAEIISVDQRGSKVIYRFKGSSIRYEIDGDTDALAARIAYALDFLKQACDPARDTGF